MKTTLFAGLGVALLLLVACGTSGPTGELATEADDVVGTWRRTKVYGMFKMPEIYMQVRADGTIGFSRVPDKWDYEWMSLEFAFEGTHCSVTETAFHFWEDDPRDFSCGAGEGEWTGVYEIELLANGNLKFVNAQDNCRMRREVLALVDWEPVP